MHARPTDLEYLAIDLQPGEMVLEVLNRFRSEGWEYDRVDRTPGQAVATLHLKRKLPGAESPESPFAAGGMKPGPCHSHARRWTVADDDIVRTHSARDAAQLLEVSIATIYVRRQLLGIRSQNGTKTSVHE